MTHGTVTANWAGNYSYRAPRVHRPTTVDQLQRVVAAAEHAKALGSRHSFNDIADTAGDLLDLTGLPDDIEVDRDASTVSACGATPYGRLAVVLQQHSLALPNLASLPHISIAGAVATGTHGSGVLNQGLASAVTGLEIVQGDGEVLRLSAADESFDGAVVALGALGVVSRVTLAVEPTFDVRQDVFEGLPWAELAANFDTIMSAAHSVSLFTDLQGQVVDQVWCKSRLDSDGVTGPDGAQFPGPPDSLVFDASGRVRDSLFGATPATVSRHPLPGLPGDVCTGQLGVRGPWYERLPHFRLAFTPSNGDEVQSEYLVPRANAAEMIDILRGVGAAIAPLLQVCEIRTVAADELWLSPAYRQDTVAFHFTWRNDQPAVQRLLARIEDAIAGCRPRPHWGKLFAADAGALAAVYGRLPDFRRLAGRLDSDGVFRNDYLDRYVFAV